MSRRLFRQLEDVCISLGGIFREDIHSAVCAFKSKSSRGYSRLRLYETGYLEFIRPLPPHGEHLDIIDMDNVEDIWESADGSSILIKTSEGLLELDKTTGTIHLKV